MKSFKRRKYWSMGSPNDSLSLPLASSFHCEKFLSKGWEGQ